MEEIIKYIKQNYAPETIIVYGSYASGTNNENSDFDALVISETHEAFHDTSFVNNVQLDVFVYPNAAIQQIEDYAQFIQIFDGNIILDTNGVGQKLQQSVLEYINTLPAKTVDEIKDEIEWCKKMFMRTKRTDAEGLFRWHWLLVDTLEIFCDAVHHPYFGPKKSLIWMKQHQPEAYSCYEKALRCFDEKTTQQWIRYLENIL